MVTQPVSKRRQARWIVGGLVALVLVLGWGRLSADPDRPDAVQSSPVALSEFAAAGAGGLFDEDGDQPDWIEIHNRSRRTVDLDGWTLTDDPTQPDKWTFRSTLLEPGATLVVFASGKNQRRLEPEEGHPFLHTNFRLDADGGHLALYPPTSRRYLDATVYDYPAQVAEASYGLVEEGGRWVQRYLTPPTPDALNEGSAVWQGVLPAVTASAPRGFFDAPLTVTLQLGADALAPADVAIRYTTDGSTPTLEQGLPYTGPLTIAQTTPLRARAFAPGYLPSPILTQSYVFVDDALTQPADPPGWPDTWGVHRIDIGPYRSGEPVAADYAMDARIVDDPTYGPQVRTGLLALPTVSLALDPADMDIYADPQTRGPESERPVSVEWLDPTGAEPGFQVDAGVRIQGGAGRWEFMPKHPLRLFFRQEYGAARLEYPLFPASDATEFDTLVLRAGVDRSFAGHPSTPELPVDHRQATYARDEWARASQLALSGAGSHGRFVHLYINGLYWGLYNVVERPDDAFAATYLGGEQAAWATASHGGAVAGSLDRFDALLRLAQEGGLSDPAKYATFLEFFDPAQFADYLILNWYAGNRDWPENNWYVNVENPAGRNQFFVWDAEGTWDDGAAIRLGSDGWDGAPYPNVVKQVLLAAWESPEFRLVLADRLYRHLFNDGALTDANAQARWRAITEPLEVAIAAESARWGDVRYPDAPITVGDWQAARDRVLAQMDGNAAKLVQLAREAGYYPDIDPPQFDPHGAEFQTSVTVTVVPADVGAGEVYWTTDGSDPREAVTGAVAAGAQPLTGPLVLTTTTTLKARTRVDGEWSALAEAVYRRSGEHARLVISEIMYHPYVDEEMEFLEIKNLGELALDLSGATLDAINYRFGDGTVIGPGEHLVVVRDLKKFRRRYGEAAVHGIYPGKLSDKGEKLVLRDRAGAVLAAVAYDDDRGWPLSADGAGDSLEWIEGCSDAQARACWRASETLYGTPGADEPGRG